MPPTDDDKHATGEAASTEGDRTTPALPLNRHAPHRRVGDLARGVPARRPRLKRETNSDLDPEE